MRKLIYFCFISFGLLLSSIASAKTSLDGIVVFGDSLSDNGNLYKMKQGKVLGAPYYLGRCSNGLVWVEILTKELHFSSKQLDDRAIAGAQTSGSHPPGAIQQINRYIDENPQLDPNKLYILWIGGNNYLYHPFGRTHRVNKTIGDINKAITLLAKHGAHYILVPNLPDIGANPLAAKLQQKRPHLGLKANLTQLSLKHNEKLEKDLPALQQKLGPNVDILLMNDYALMETVEVDPSKYGIKNLHDACYNGPKLFQGGGTVCKDPNQYLFWDAVHPTFTGHEALAGLALQTLKNAGVVTSH
ncbi:MAG: SGNH/GDSL hydrolase family protein [Gammaproteobacteria bacterium]|nr:SGNH/GDSL hydrolase family protein [Gammaproteobacteria bacterium]